MPYLTKGENRNTGRTWFKKEHIPWDKGKKFTEEHKRKISEAKKGKKLPSQCGFQKGHPNYHSEESKKKISEAQKRIKKPWVSERNKGLIGEKAHNWKGGISFEPYSIDWTDTLKRAIRERDNYICQLCSQYGNTVHHKDYIKQNCNPDNLITLCVSCNIKVNYSRDYWLNYFKI